VIALLLAAMMAVQGAGKLQPGTGIVTGALKTTDGKPAVGVRVGAVDIDDPSASSLLSVAETDAAGRYRLINVPVGRYYIVAGRLSDLHFYPEGADRSKATQIQVEAARTSADVNFIVPGGSQRPINSSPVAARNPGNRNSQESVLYQQVAAENNIERKVQLLAQFEKTFPKSSLLPNAYLSAMAAYVSRNDVLHVVEYAEKAVKADPANITTLIQVSRMYAGPPLQMTDKALAHAERALMVAAGLKNQVPATVNLVAWERWAESMNTSARENLAWVRQMDAWQHKALSSLVAPTRKR
jgi:5-hydroxyisourate hydrolase-like protein (transthyretin family)